MFFRSFCILSISLFAFIHMTGCSNAADQVSQDESTGENTEDNEISDTDPVAGGENSSDPIIASRLFPPDGAARVPTSSTVAATFDNGLDNATISDSTITVGNGIAGSVFHDPAHNRVVFTPDEPLAAGQSYTVSITGLQTADNNDARASWQFTTAHGQFFHDIEAGANTVLGTETGLFDPSSYNHRQMLYFDSEFNSSNGYPGTKGYIHGLTLQYNAALNDPVTCRDVTIKMGHTANDALNTAFGNNLNNSKGRAQTVLEGVPVTFPAAGIDSKVDILFERSFYYNGVDPLVVDVERADCDGTVPIRSGNNGNQLNSSMPALTGNLVNTRPLTSFLFTGGTVSVEFPLTNTNTAPSSSPGPFTNNNYSQRVLSLYPATELNAAGTLAGIGLKLADVSIDYTYTLSVFAGHSNSASLAINNIDTNFAASPDPVTEAIAFHIPGNFDAGDYLWIPFQNSFNYNGLSNLLLDFRVTAGINAAVQTFETGDFPGAANVRTRGNKPEDGNVTWAEGSYGSNFNALLRFGDDRTGIVNNLNPYNQPTWPFDGTTGLTFQMLLKNAELGNQGNITAMAFRLLNAATAETYPGVSLTLGHTDLDALSGAETFESTMIDPVNVFQGDFTIPADLGAGDWLVIPFDTPFSYDPTKNLIFQLTTNGGIGQITNKIVHQSNARYTGRFRIQSNGGGTSPANASGNIIHVQFFYDR